MNTLNLLADMKDAATEVDVLPAQAEHFAAPHAVQQQKHKRRVQRIVCSGGEEGQGFG